MIFDSHVHTVKSCDADTTIAEAVRMAEEKGIGLVITDHMDWDFPAPFPDFRVDLPGFFREYAPLRSDKLLLGIELGMTAESADTCQEIVGSQPFDFVLGSVHVLHGCEVDDRMYADCDEAEIYREYLQEAARLVETVPMDALAHIDYPLRTTSRELPYADYAAEFDALFAAMRRQSVCLELNTSRLADETAYANLLNIFRAYCKAGSRYVTLGSDAHEPQEIADSFGLATVFLQETGLIPVHFCQRKMMIDK